MFDNFIAEATTVFVVTGIGLFLSQNKNPVMKLAGGLFCLFALVVALESPSLLRSLAVAAVGYLAFLVAKNIAKKRKKARKCSDCEHDAHARGRCRNRYCDC